MFQDETVETLVNLGLTVLQAKVYIALAQLGTSTGRTAAKEAKVASQDVYRILIELQEKGLAEKIIAKPTMYKAIPMKEGLTILLQNKKQEYIETENKVKTMVNNFYKKQNRNNLPENSQFVITSEIKHLLQLHDKLADMAKKDINFIFSTNPKILFNNCRYVNRATRRGVKVRLIIQKNDGETIEIPKSLSKNPLFEVRCLPQNAIPFGMYIFDKQEVTLTVSEKPIPSLWTNSPHVVKLAQAHFEHLWHKAKLANHHNRTISLLPL